MNKKILFYPIYILIFFSVILWLLDYSFNKKQFTFIKIKSLNKHLFATIILKNFKSGHTMGTVIDFFYENSLHTN